VYQFWYGKSIRKGRATESDYLMGNSEGGPLDWTICFTGAMDWARLLRQAQGNGVFHRCAW